jgi:hypothetical protein
VVQHRVYTGKETKMEEYKEVSELLAEQRQEQPEQPNRPAKVSFDAAQQNKVNDLIREAQGRAGREAREKLAEAERRLAAYEAASPSSAGAQELGAQIAALRAEKSALEREKSEMSINAALHAVAGDFVDPALAADLMKANVRLENGKITVVGADGTEMRNNQLNPMTLAELAADMATKRPYLVKGRMSSGLGSAESVGRTPTDQSAYLSTLFGRKANAKAANQLAIRDIRQYRALKAEAQKRGIC